ncbi:MAG: HEAT repeat domain-containing protein [Sandaracinaceae bacterium]
MLTHYLSRSTNASVKEDIVRTLSVPWARASAPAIADEFARVAANDESGLGWALGNALEVLAGPHLASRMYEFAEDRRYGRARQMVVLGLARIPSSQTVDVLIRLLADDEVVGHAAMALGKLKATPARQQLKLLESHPVDWVRKAVRKALINLDK